MILYYLDAYTIMTLLQLDATRYQVWIRRFWGRDFVEILYVCSISEDDYFRILWYNLHGMNYYRKNHTELCSVVIGIYISGNYFVILLYDVSATAPTFIMTIITRATTPNIVNAWYHSHLVFCQMSYFSFCHVILM